jgi:hypothetical protein
VESDSESEKEEEDEGEEEEKEDDKDEDEQENKEDEDEETGDPTKDGGAGGEGAGGDDAGVEDAGGDNDEVPGPVPMPGLDEPMGNAAEKVSFMLHGYYADDSLVGTYSGGSRCASCGHCRQGVCLPASSRYQCQEDKRPQATGKGSHCLYGQG